MFSFFRRKIKRENDEAIIKDESATKEQVLESASSDTESKEDVKPTKESIQSLYNDVQRIVPVYDTSDVGKARYLIEHQMLRDMFFSQPEKTIHILLSPNGLYYLISIV